MASIPFNLILCTLLGLCLTACARTQLVSGATPWRRELSLVLSFSLLTVAPAAAYYYLFYKDWSWMYYVDPARLPVGTGLAVLVVLVALVPAGYFLGWLLLKTLGLRALFFSIGALSVALVFFVVLSRDRLLHLGHYEDFHAAHGSSLLRPISQTKLLWAMLATFPLVLASASVAGYYLWGYGRWLRRATTPSQPSIAPNP